MRVGEPGQHTAPVQVDALVADGVGISLAHVNAARDQFAGHRQRPHLGQARIHRVDRAVVEDQAAGSLRRVIAAEEIDGRLARFQAALAAGGMDAAVIVASTDLAYLTGTNQQAHLIVPASGRSRLLVRRTLERAREESPLELIEPLGSLSGLPAALAGCGVDDGALVGFELDVLPAARYLGYQRRLPGYRLGDCSQALRSVRAVKTGWELEQMRAAAEQVRVAAERVPSLLRAGVSEATVQADVERVLRGAGHQGQLRFRGFNQEMHYGQVLCGPSGAVPGYSDSPLCGPGPNPVLGKGPDDHVLAAGDPVIVDLVGGHQGYLADQTRTFALGPACRRPARRVRPGGRDPARGRARDPSRDARPARCSSWPSSWPSGPGWASTSWATATAASASSATAWAWRSTSCRCWRPGSTSPWSRGT